MNEYNPIDSGNDAGQGGSQEINVLRNEAYSLYHLPLSYSFVEGISDALLHE
jgi:hypothetical protein